MKIDLKYKDEQDKCYGLTGVAMCAVIWDVENLISAIYLDCDAFNSIQYVPQLVTDGNVEISPRNAWKLNVEKFRLSMGMILSNILCRTYVLEQKYINHKTKQYLLNYFIEDGIASCSLEKDEVEELFNKNYDYLLRVFSHPEVQKIANEFSELLTERRSLTQSEIVNALQTLNML